MVEAWFWLTVVGIVCATKFRSLSVLPFFEARLIGCYILEISFA